MTQFNTGKALGKFKYFSYLTGGRPGLYCVGLTGITKIKSVKK